MTPALPAGCAIAVLGAPGTGRHQLATQLLERMAQRGMATPVRVLDDPATFTEALSEAPGPLVLLLMALDLPPTAAEPPASSADRESIDAALRAALMRAGAPFSVIHGRGAERLANAWTALNARAEAADLDASRQGAGGRATDWAWSCEKCSDPGCEHRLFSDLIARRTP